jgi:integrase/recombinase XerC
MDINTFLATYASENTRKAYALALTAFQRFLGDREIDAQAVDEYRTALMARYGCAATANQMLSALRAYGVWASRLGLVAAAVAKHLTEVKGYRKQDKLPRLLTEEQLERFLDAPDVSTDTGRRDRAILWTLYTAGLRVGELVGLDVADVNGNKLHIRDGKGQKDRVALISETTATAIAAYVGSRVAGPIFLNQRGQRLTTRAIQMLVAHYGAVIGRDDIHPHLLRHQFATTLLDETSNLVLVADLMGHTSVRTTQHYTRLATKYSEKAHRSVFK